MDRKIIRRIRSLMKKYGANQADAFDLDGTVINGDLLVGAVRSIVQGRQSTNAKRFAYVKSLTNEVAEMNPLWRCQHISKEDSVKLVEKGLFEGLQEKEIHELIYTGMEQIMASCFSFPRSLILALRKRNPRRLLVCITGTPQEIADIICPYLGFDAVVGCRYPKKDGVFITGKRNIDAGLKKGQTMDAISKQCGISWHNGIVMGNGKYDFEMFERGTYPIAMNPEKPLQELIRKTKLDSWKTGYIAWVDQSHGASFEEHQIWLPNSEGKLIESKLEEILPEDLINSTQEIGNRRRSEWFSL